jgi:glyoxylase I family protein
MTAEVIGVDHIFVAVGDLGRSEEFYDRVMAILGFRKGEGTIGGDPHLFYYNRQFAYSLRPAREGAPAHDPYAPGLHHLCFRVVDEAAVDRAAGGCGRRGSRPRSRATVPSTPQPTTRPSSRTPTA